MNTKKLIHFVSVVVLLTLYIPALAQQPKQIPRIAFLSTSNSRADNTRYDGIRQQLRELGYIEGQNIVIEYRSGGRDLEGYRKAVAELARLNVDIIVVGGGTTFVEVVKKTTQSRVTGRASRPRSTAPPQGRPIVSI